MIKKITNKINLLKKISLIQYIYLNFFSKNIIRHGRGKILPYKHACTEFDKKSELHIYDESIEIGKGKIKGSKAETYLRLRENAKWYAYESCDIAYGCTIEILNNAIVESKYFTMNVNSTMISKKHISIGHNVMIGRNVIIYDSDFHCLYSNEGKIINEDNDIIINDNVWICTNSMILKGSSLDEGIIVAANSIISEKIYEKNTVIFNRNEIEYRKNIMRWER